MEASGNNGPAGPLAEATEDTIALTSSPSRVTDEQWRAMRSVLDFLLSYRDEEGHDPTKMFHKNVNRRNVPDYYEVIKEPTAFSNLKQRIADREYKKFADFVRDNALIWHNAHTYNRPDAGAYQDASVLKDLMEERFQRLAAHRIVTTSEIQWPDLGEIPPVEDLPEDEEEDDEDDEEEDDADDSEEEVPKKRGPGRPRLRDVVPGEKQGDTGKKRRGRPPKVDTPMDIRIKNVLKGMRKPRNQDGLMIYNFEKLPEKAAMPEYYATIKRPIAIDQIRKSLRRKRYRTVDDFMRDIDIMFENAKHYNEDDSLIYQAAVTLQQEAHRLADIERNRADAEFFTEEGRRPRPGGIQHNGEIWRVGDWVHINNSNDPTKPIIAQIYRAWQDSDGQEWINACWYYRPEQTVHHYEKHFYPMEVFKTGQYRDHPIDDILEHCYVMFITRFPKGRPRGLPMQAKVYVCEARYNEEKHKINKIKTWASCLPDEIRDQDYEMDIFFDGPRRHRKMPSPLLYMLDQGEVSERVPQPKWGEENAPPIVGGLYRGPRDENQSPPPDTSPSPPPEPLPQPRYIAPPPTMLTDDPWGKADEHFKKVTETFNSTPHARGYDANLRRSYTPQPQFKHHHPPPASAPGHAVGGYGSHGQAAYTPQPPHHPHQQQPATPATAPGPYKPQYPTPTRPTFSAHPPPQSAQQQQPRFAPTPPVMPSGRQADAFILNDHQNAQVPEDVREQFQTDENGRILFFTKPPAPRLPSERASRLSGHTIKYRAAKLRRQLANKLDEAESIEPVPSKLEDNEERETSAQPCANKRRRIAVSEQANGTTVHLNDFASLPRPPLEVAFAASTGQDFNKWLHNMQSGTAALLRAMQPGADITELEAANQAQVDILQARAREEQDALNQRALAKRDREERRARELWKVPEVFMDDVDPRLLRY